MKRALWITFIAVALVAARGDRLDRPPLRQALPPRAALASQARRLVHAHELAEHRRRDRRSGWGSRPTAYAR